jgi:hypothetical protein
MRTLSAAVLALSLAITSSAAATPKASKGKDAPAAAKTNTKADLESASSIATKPHQGADLGMKAVKAKIGAPAETDDKTFPSSILYSWFAKDSGKCWRLQVTRSRADNALNSAMVSEESAEPAKCDAAK